MPGGDDLDVLAGLRFIETRHIEGYQKRTREIFTTRLKSKIGQEIYKACLGAMRATEEDRDSTARFLTLIATRPVPLPTSRMAQDTLQPYRREAEEVLLAELGNAHPPERLIRCVQVLHQLSRVAPPEQPPFWRKAARQDRQNAAEVWRQRIQSAGVR